MNDIKDTSLPMNLYDAEEILLAESLGFSLRGEVLEEARRFLQGIPTPKESPDDEI